MEKIKNAVILFIEILFVVAIIIFVGIYISSQSTEDDYQKALKLIESNHYTDATTYLEKIPHYKDASELYIYMYPYALYYGKYKTPADKMVGYKNAVAYMVTTKGKLLTRKYKDGFNELAKTINFKLEEFNAKTKNDDGNVILNDSANLIKQGDYFAAGTKLDSITQLDLETIKIELKAYISFLNAVNLGKSKGIITSIESLDPDYTGILNTDIKNAVLAYVDDAKWRNIYKRTTQATAGGMLMPVGKKKEEVIAEMGSPLSVYEFSNKYGHFESMKYENSKIFYLENNIVTAYK